MNFIRLRVLSVVLLTAVLSSCSNEPKLAENAPGFSDYIAAHTAGVISTHSAIEIQLQTALNPGVEPGTVIDADVFDFDPDIEGVTTWGSDRQIIFRPDERLPQGVVYSAEFHLGALMEVEDQFNTFEFNFQSMEQSYSVLQYSIESYSNTDLIWNQVTGEISSADKASIEELIEEIEWKGIDPEKVNWSFNGTPNRFTFTVDSVERKAERIEFEALYNDNILSVFRVPGLSEFEVVDVFVEQVPRQTVIISFSDPISTSQQTAGLFRLGDRDVTSVEVEGSVVRLYHDVQLHGNVQLRVSEGLKNVLGYSFPKTYTRTVSFQSKKPEVRFLDDGNIIPTEGKVHIPFQAVSLRAVDVRIYKVYADNVHQFLQVNTLSGERELRRVARPVHQQRLELTGTNVNYSDWTTYSIDLDQMIRRDPGALYRVELSFRKSYSMYYCEGDDAVDIEPLREEDWDAPQEDYYYYDDYYYDYYMIPGYDYRERDNPCHVSYYNSSVIREKNVLASDIGLIVKGNRGKFHAYVTSIARAAGISGAEVRLYNYQGQLLGKKNTDGEGVAHLEVDGVPFVAQVNHGDERAYVKLEPGKSLPISSFDVGGADASSGIQAFLYGERGIWRPGDTVFLNAVLNDAENSLPANHPLLLTVKDPEGKEVFRSVKQRGTQSIFSFMFVTDREARTGTYSATLEVGGKRFYKSIPVETIQPNRFDIKLETVGKVIQGGSTPYISVLAEWLTGAKASGMKVQIEGRIARNNDYFKEFQDEGFDFEDDLRTVPVISSEMIFEGNLNESGSATVQPNLGYLKNSPGMLTLITGTKVYEPSGRFSINSTRLPLAPFTHFVGVRMPETNNYGYLETDKNHRIDLVRVNSDGNPVSGPVKVSIYKVTWSWWWSARRGTATYLNREVSQLLNEGQVNLANGRGSFDFEIGDDHWGRILVIVEDPNSGHRTSSLSYVDWAWGRDRTGRAGGESATMLNIQTDKEKYNVGDVAQITIPSSEGGRLLLSVEDGTRQLMDEILTSQTGQTVYNLKITPEMAPNVYIHGMLLQPHAQSGNDLPLRLYGIVPLMVEDEATHLEPVITAPESIRPESDYTIKIKEANGRKMEYTLAVVDEGLLGITNFRTPDPWSYFYAKRALGVRTWDMYDFVIGAFSGKIARMLAVGGDAALLPDNEENADRFVPVVRHLGPFTLEPGKTAQHKLHMPNYIGNVRVMVVAANKDEAYGSANRNIRVKQPLMAQLTMPRVLGPGEDVKIPVTLFVMDESIRSVDVRLNAQGNVSVPSGRQTVRFSDGEDQKTIFFDAKVKEALGLATVSVIATSGNERSTDEIEIGVRSPLLPQTREEMTVIEGVPVGHAEAPFGLRGSNDLVIELSNLPNLNLEEKLKYLISYPHGCLEQTTSRSFAQLNLDNWVELSADQKANIQNNVREGLNKIRRMQMTDGGFRYWPNQTYYNAWSSTYAGHFIISAEMSGYTLPVGLKETYLRFERGMARSWSPGSPYRYNNDLNQAYRLYTLALAGEPEIGAMNRLRNRSSLSEAAARRLAAAFAIMGEKSIATELMNRTWSTTNNDYYYYSYGSASRDLAMYIETLYDMGNTAEAYRLARQLAEDLSKGYHSTQTLAFSLHVLSKIYGQGTDELEATVVVNGRTYEVNTNSVVYQIEVDDFEEETSVRITNHNSSPVYARYLSTGVPRFGTETAYANRVTMDVEYLDAQRRPLDVTNLKVGTPITARVVVRRPISSRDYENMALTQIFPSGWEISNSRVMETSSTGGEGLDFQDIRDNKVLSYFSLYHQEQVTIYVELTASYPGRWYLPPAQVESMYEGTVGAANTGKWVEVVR